MVKNLPAVQETQVNSWVGKILWRREQQPTPVFLPREFGGQRSLAGYSPWDHKETDTTEWLIVWCKYYSYGEGNGTPLQYSCLEKSHGQRSLVGCSPWGHKESDKAEWLHFHFSLSCIGEGNGNPLQCSCLENPRDGVAQSRTRLKWLSSSSSNYS